MTDPIADMITRIRNAILVRKTAVTMPFSRIKFAIAKILEREGFIAKVEKISPADRKTAELSISLKYKDKSPSTRGLKRISKPGLRVYKGYKEMPRMLPSLGILIISTSRGLMSNTEAKKQKIGGEVLCEIY